MKRTLLFAASAIVGLAIAVLVCWGGQPPREQLCSAWAADLGLDGNSVTVACNVGPNPEGEMTEAEFQQRMNESLGRAWELLDENGGL